MDKIENKLSSREVAEMMDVEHSKLLRKIEDINEDFRESKIGFSKYWIESTYTVDGNNKSYKEFQVTIRGCEFLAHKTTGTKGNLFTDKYMDKFVAMENIIQMQSYMIDNPIERAKAWIQEEEKRQLLLTTTKKQEQIIHELKPKADYTDLILKNKGLVTITQIAKDYGMSGTQMNKKLHELGVQYKQSGQWLLYTGIQGNGYTHSETINITRTGGIADISMITKWTQKGRLFLYDLLKQNYLLPLIERKEVI